MKTSIKTFVCALALVTTASFASNAEDKEIKKSTGFGTGIYPTKTGKINVLVDKGTLDAPTVILLKDENGDVVYRETVDKNVKKFGRILNVNDLSAGKYNIEVISQGERQTKSFELSERKIERVLEIK